MTDSNYSAGEPTPDGSSSQEEKTGTVPTSASAGGITAAEPKPAVSPPRKRHRFRNFMLLLLLVFVIGGAIWTWATVTISYSTGEKTGFVQNLSKQGWLCKTWEGVLAVEPAPGALPEVFPFTIRDDSVAAALQQVLPTRVALTYELHRGVPTSCFGETPYYISGFRTVD